MLFWGLNFNSTCHRHGGQLLWSGKSHWSYANVNPKLLPVWPNLAEAASTANYFSPHSNDKLLFPLQEARMVELCSTHLEVWAGCVCREEVLFQVGGMPVPSLCSPRGAWAPAAFDFSKPSLLVGWPGGRKRWIQHGAGFHRMGSVLWMLLVFLPSFIYRLSSALNSHS